MSQIKFCLSHQVYFGQGVYLVSSQNDWKIEESCRMTCIKVKMCSNMQSNRWELVLQVTDAQLEYKYVIADYDSPSGSVQIWERGNNRKLIKSKSNSSETIKDMWEKRMISLKLMALNNNSLAIVIGNFPALSTPIQMKLLDKKSMKYFSTKFYIDITNSEQVIQFQYYLLIKDPSKEFCNFQPPWNSLVTQQLLAFRKEIRKYVKQSPFIELLYVDYIQYLFYRFN
ncbi:unnamed protein product (macronuclear) [Paramecium tetraurelia]|uniref:CBM20 domain-containing protein n=1 Tax=Paramecium tetraurelia TaxID=5888 RepID=A0C1I7_PARTE|nr:uncharacterized protein GSPATT00034130001 [Paramecium tetraurelia]CAK64654.1 unnamed protein product [Paramecium tetraurelia]|eukprot:XP_001432051.1 hypothetical protein (macronuclear) [Paramecium tetraurelia strain d4-2]